MGAVAWLFMGLFWVLLIGAIVWLVVQLTSSSRRSEPAAPAPGPGPWGGGGQGPTTPAAPTPLEVLDRRLAAGEIDVTSYQQVRAALLESRDGKP